MQVEDPALQLEPLGAGLDAFKRRKVKRLGAFGEEEEVQAFGVRVGFAERIARCRALELTWCQHKDARLEAMARGDGGSQLLRHTYAIGYGAAEDHVAALDVRLNIDAAMRFEHNP